MDRQLGLPKFLVAVCCSFGMLGHLVRFAKLKFQASPTHGLWLKIPLIFFVLKRRYLGGF